MSKDEFVSVNELLRKTDGPKVDDVFDNPKDSTEGEIKKNDSGKENNFDETDSVEDQESNDVDEMSGSSEEIIDVLDNSIDNEEMSGSREEIVDILDSSSDNEEKNWPKKKTEVEILAIENKEFQELLEDPRSRRSSSNCYQFRSSHWMASMVGESTMCNMVEVIGRQLKYEGDMLDEAEDFFDLDEEGGFLL